MCVVMDVGCVCHKIYPIKKKKKKIYPMPMLKC